MNALPELGIESLRTLSQAATGSLAAAIWQGILLALAAALALRLLPRVPAAARFAIWFAVFLAIAALPLTWLLPHRAGVAPGTHPLLVLDARWCLAILALWAIASLVRATTLLFAALRLRALWKRAEPIELAAPDVKYNRAAQLCVSDEIDRPSVIGFFSPKILIPRWLLDKLTLAELHQIVLHEGTHLRRADDWLNLLQKLALVLFPLNPALLWVERKLCKERELACDEQVLRATGAPKAYAACLASLAQHRLARRIAPRSFALALGALGRTSRHEPAPRSELGRRIHSILTSGARMGTAHARLVTGAATLALVVAAGELSRSPQFIAFSTSAAPTALAAPAPLGPVPMGRYTTENVVFRPTKVSQPRWNASRARKTIRPTKLFNTNVMQSKQSPAHEIFLKASVPNADDDAPTQQPVRPVHGWTVVTTSWVASDGSRLVLTTADTSDVYPATVVPDADDADLSAQPTSTQLRQVHPYAHPYAAVPVRGGWLILQL